MNKLIELTKEDIIKKYLNKPILIVYAGKKTWYIVSDVDTQMPLHMLTPKEATLYGKDKNYINGVEFVGIGTEESYAMWIYFNKKRGWKAYGYE